MHVWQWDWDTYIEEEDVSEEEIENFDTEKYFTELGFKSFGSTFRSDSDACSHGIFSCESAREKGFSEFVIVTSSCDEDLIEFYVK